MSVTSHLVLSGFFSLFRRYVIKNVSVWFFVFLRHKVKEKLKLISVHLDVCGIAGIDELVLSDIAISFSISVS